MHELGIVFYIIKDVKEAAAENGVGGGQGGGVAGM